jgi:hypothetical protein
MDPKTKTSNSYEHTSPYEKYEGTPVWKVVEKAISDLVDNDDIVETARRDYIVGFICKKLQRLLPKDVS